jgi:hypothetical protein
VQCTPNYNLSFFLRIQAEFEAQVLHYDSSHENYIKMIIKDFLYYLHLYIINCYQTYAIGMKFFVKNIFRVVVVSSIVVSFFSFKFNFYV